MCWYILELFIPCLFIIVGVLFLFGVIAGYFIGITILFAIIAGLISLYVGVKCFIEIFN